MGSTTNKTSFNRCSETAVEYATKVLNLGEINFPYVTKDQVDMTPAFRHAPAGETMVFDSSKIDLAGIDDNSSYFYRKGANGIVGKSESGHWEVLTAKEVKQHLNALKDTLSKERGKQSVYIAKVTHQNVINAANFLYAYRMSGGDSESVEQDQVVRTSAGCDATRVNTIAFNLSITGADQANEKLNKYLEGERNELNKRSNMGREPLIVGVRKQSVDRLVDRANDKSRRGNPVAIRLISRQGSGLPELTDLEKSSLLKNSFNLVRTNEQINEQRHLTKWRAITSPCQLYGNDSDFFDTPIELIVTTGSAPNLGITKGKPTSLKDTKRYLDRGGFAKYEQDFKILLKAWLEEQITYGAELIIMPLIGSGIYLPQEIRAEGAKHIQKIITETVKEFLAKSENDSLRIYLAKYNKDETNAGITCWSKGGETQDTELLKKSGGHADIFKIIPQLKELHPEKTIGVINAGADNNIGGKCAIFQKDGKAISQNWTTNPFEEQLADYSDLILNQSMEFNKAKIDEAVKSVLKVKTPVEEDKNTESPLMKLASFQRAAKSDEDQKTRFAFSQDKVPKIDKIDEFLGSKQNEALKEYFKTKLSPKYASAKKWLEGDKPLDQADDATKIIIDEVRARAINKEARLIMQMDHNPNFSNPKMLEAKLKAKLDKKPIVVMTLVTDHQKDLKLPPKDIVKVHDDLKKPLFTSVEVLMKYIDDAKIKIELKKGESYTIIGKKVDAQNIDFYKKDLNGKETVVSKDDLVAFAQNTSDKKSLSEVVMDKVAAHLEANKVASVFTQVRDTQAYEKKYRPKP